MEGSTGKISKWNQPWWKQKVCHIHQPWVCQPIRGYNWNKKGDIKSQLHYKGQNWLADLLSDHMTEFTNSLQGSCPRAPPGSRNSARYIPRRFAPRFFPTLFTSLSADSLLCVDLKHFLWPGSCPLPFLLDFSYVQYKVHGVKRMWFPFQHFLTLPRTIWLEWIKPELTAQNLISLLR